MTWRLTLVAILLGVAAADWPQWRGPKRDGGTPEVVPAWKDPPKVLWQVPVGPAYSSPVVAGGRVIAHTRVPDKDEEEIVAYDTATGKVLWREVYARAAYASAVGTGPRATPTVAGGRVYALGITGVLTCCRVGTGERVWQVDLYKQLNATLPRFGVCGSPLVFGDRVYVSVGGKGRCLVCLDAATGEVKWQSLDEAASSASPVLFAAAGRGPLPDVVYATPLRLVGVNPLDGSINWEHPLVYQPSGTSSTPVVTGDRVVAGTVNDGVSAVQVAVADGKATAKPAWRGKDYTVYFSSGVAAGADKLYLVTNTLQPLPSAALRCINPTTGKELWVHRGIGYFHAGLLRMGDGKLLVLDDAGTLKLIDSDPKEYRELCKAKVCGGTLVTPALAGGCLFARDDKNLSCLRLAPPAPAAATP
jgi:outer membrane protein assembly factor BamB